MNPIATKVQHPFQATNPYELTIRPGQVVHIAPRDVQNTHKLLNTGWLLATVDNVTSGMIPVNYIEHPSQKSAWSPTAAMPESAAAAAASVPVFTQLPPDAPPPSIAAVSSTSTGDAVTVGDDLTQFRYTPKIDEADDSLEIKHTVAA